MVTGGFLGASFFSFASFLFAVFFVFVGFVCVSFLALKTSFSVQSMPTVIFLLEKVVLGNSDTNPRFG